MIMKVSIIIPTYNRGHFLKECINSVLASSLNQSEWEIVVVDDGSTDNTLEIVKSFRSVPIRYIYQPNQGVAIARNTGINYSHGEYILFLDSDDCILERTIEQELLTMEKYPKVAFCFSQVLMVDKAGKTLYLNKRRGASSTVIKGTDLIKDYFIYGYNLGSSANMVRRSCLQEAGLFDPFFRHGSEDYDLFTRLAKRFPVAFIAEPLLKYRIHSGGISVGRNIEEYEVAQNRILSSIFNDTSISYLLTDKRSEAYFRLCLRLASYAYVNKNMKASRKYLLRALTVYPNEFIKGQWILSWITQLGKTFIPIPILQMLLKARNHV